MLIHSRLHFQVCSTGCSHLQNGCQPHYHAADCVLTSGCSFISEPIGNEILIALTILGKYIMIEQLSAGKWTMYIHISGWHASVCEHCSSLIVTGCCGWRKRRSRRRWCWLGWRCTGDFAPPTSLRILCSAILARKEAVCKSFKNHSRMSFYRSLQCFMRWNHNRPLLLISDFGPWFLNQALCFLNCGAQKPSFGHFGYDHRKVHVELF